MQKKHRLGLVGSQVKSDHKVKVSVQVSSKLSESLTLESTNSHYQRPSVPFRADADHDRCNFLTRSTEPPQVCPSMS